MFEIHQQTFRFFFAVGEIVDRCCHAESKGFVLNIFDSLGFAKICNILIANKLIIKSQSFLRCTKLLVNLCVLFLFDKSFFSL